MPGQTAQDYQLTPGMAINAAVARAWDAALGAHRAWKTALARLPETDPATALTRDKWLLPLLYELGYGRPKTLPPASTSRPGSAKPSPRTTRSPTNSPGPTPAPTPQVAVPLHLVGAGVALDTPTPGVTARAPQSMVQELLNRSRPRLWGIISNGHTVRLLRDASSLTKQSYVEFDLDDIFDNQRYAEFRLFFLTVHASRITPIAPPTTTAAVAAAEADDEPDDDGKPTESLTPESCWLEQWRTMAIADGTRALRRAPRRSRPRPHPPRHRVRLPPRQQPTSATMLAAAPDADKDLHRALLRIAYRLIVLFVAEDRDLLHTASNDTERPSASTGSTSPPAGSGAWRPPGPAPGTPTYGMPT